MAMDLTKNITMDTTAERPSCKFGHACYRNNPSHREEQAHPGDNDYSSLHTAMPSPPENAPKCKYGRNCYRQNPEHFQNFRHPRITHNSSLRHDDDSCDEDPFAGDSESSDYVPSEDD